MNYKTVIKNFEIGNKANAGNYLTDGSALFLFRNKIAEKRSDGIYFSLAGYETSTTTKALNQISGLRVSRSKGKITANGIEIDSTKWYNVNKIKDNTDAEKILGEMK